MNQCKCFYLIWWQYFHKIFLIWQLTAYLPALTDWVKVLLLHPNRHKIGNLIDVLPSQSLGVVLKKLNRTQQANTRTKSSMLNQKNTQNKCTKTKPKPTLTCKNRSYVRLYYCAQLLYTTQHRTVLIIFPLILKTIIIVQKMSTGREGVICQHLIWLLHL